MNISPQTVNDLCGAGWDTVRVNRVLLPTAADEEILEAARNDDRAVVTQDLDSSTLLALGNHDRPSLVTLRTSRSDPGFITQRLLDTLPVVEQQLRQGCVVTIEDTSFRVRSLPIT
jgi:predicted nuclease of predicted toxin-antitoxin system